MAFSLNPFRGLNNPREVWAWGMYDFANQSFTLLIITLLFSLYVQQVVTDHPEPSDAVAAYLAQESPAPPTGAFAQEFAAYEQASELADRRGKWNWSLMHGASYLLVVALSPLLGALADMKGYRKHFLIGTGVLCCALTASFAGLGEGMVLIAALLYIPANVSYQIGENFLASFLPSVCTRRNVGRVSAIGWTMGYIGALGLLIASLGGMLAFGWKEPRQWPPFFVFAAVWFFAGMLPATFILKDTTPLASTNGGGVMRGALGQVGRTLRHAGEFKQLTRFLVAFFVYGFGVQVIIGFASIIAGSFGFGQEQLILFVAQITVTAGVAAAGTGLFQDRIGAKTTVIVYLIVWLAACLGLVATKLVWPSGGPQWPVWVIGNLLGFGLGGIGTASRSMVARFAPSHRTAEFFGLWGVAYKLAAAVGVLAFGAVARYLGDTASLILLAGFFAAGLVLTLRVNERAGVRAARRAERAVASPV